MQLNENTYGTRGTPEQHRIINLTALVIYSLKEIPQTRMGNLYRTAERIDSVVYSFLLDSFFKEGESRGIGGFLWNEITKTLMDWIEQGVLT